ncbi:MAG: hypothetical protein M1818_006842 [Claussenomyces sp. TS43310]|nr:MAG: hypothetical protein M1818_006842 [Claussenomyces sp. TS43310]
MAAVLSETLTETSHFPKMRRDGRSQSPTSSHFRQNTRSQPRVPPSPRPQPTQAIPSQTSAGTFGPPPASSQYADASQSFASQQNFPPSAHTQLRSQQLVDPFPPRSSSRRATPALASPAPSNSSVARSSWPTEDTVGYGGTTVKVRDLAHIQSFAAEDLLSNRSVPGRRRAGSDPPVKYEISAMPITDIIEMVAGLLTKITTTNDRQHESLHRPVPTAESAANMPGLTSSVLAFHGKNVPSITILSYLSRIHKYCPTTYEVFLSLLVYFDRMTERVNAGPMQEMRRGSADRSYSSRPSTSGRSTEGDLEMAHSSALNASLPSGSEEPAHPDYATPPDEEQIQYNLSHFFVVDSFNIHRLVIAGVTCASKFFSDVFYTNSRYAKVGGLPLAELNHLELQFLLLNDFRLSVPVEELEAYGTMLVEFYAREVMAQRQAAAIPAELAYSDDIPIEAADSD